MSVLRLYLDEDCQAAALALALRAHGVDVTTTNETRHGGFNDAEQLQYATDSGRVIVSNNLGDFCALHRQWLTAGRDHAGIILFPQQAYSIGEIVRRLLRLQQSQSADEIRTRLEWLSNWGAK
jgi:hypothetical protein